MHTPYFWASLLACVVVLVYECARCSKGMGKCTGRLTQLKACGCMQVLVSLEVEQKAFVSDTFGGFQRQYWLRLRVHPMEAFPAELELTFEEVADTFSKQFLPKLKVCSCLHESHKLYVKVG